MKAVIIRLTFREDEYYLLHPLEKISELLDKMGIGYDVLREE